MPYKETKIEKLYYSIGEVSKELDVNPSAVRFWEKQFSFIKPKKNNKGNRLYTIQDFDNIRMVHYLLKDQKLTIEGAKNKIKNDRDACFNKMEAVKTLQEIRNLLSEIKEEM